MRRLIEFSCAGETLVGTIDEAPGATGLLIVSGGNEIRCGAHRGMAELAGRIAQSGFPVFRFDRRGIGDSSGDNGGFESAGPDIMAAVAAFRAAAPHITRLAGFGNCDAASALALHGGASFDRLLLANPWVREEADSLPPAAAIRARYAQRLRDPASWARLLTGKVDFGKVIKGVLKISNTNAEPKTALERRVLDAIAAHRSATILLATGDATAIGFADAARRAGINYATQEIATDSHSFANPTDKAALASAVTAMLA